MHVFQYYIVYTTRNNFKPLLDKLFEKTIDQKELEIAKAKKPIFAIKKKTKKKK
jgi:predicted transcriptional regulator YdeE